jgi:hypothetical protein
MLANGVINGVHKGAHKGRRLAKNHRRLQAMSAPQAEEDFQLLSRLPESSEQFAWLNRTHREL